MNSGFFGRWGLLGGLHRLFGLAYARIHTQVVAFVHRVEIGENVTIMPGALVRPGAGGKITLGDDVLIHSGARLLAYGGTIAIGSGSSVNPGCILYGHGGLVIGKSVLIAAGTIIIPSNHNISADREIRGQGSTRKGISIGSDVWLGANVTVLDGAEICDGAIIAAGGVVTGRRIEEMAIYGGVPARRIGQREVQRAEG
ncbi:acyltransferase [Aurantiacibacter spongiae]|uniref:Acyltransferase n=1 Tax=Aurantiacibacter spongiae TaxID=2488860 RepID=A0A3N5DIS9_9SPHN|nr:acyltransferase [Aurantiacibacter spongiae]RPF70545.1 acyltransferase [Aurantiacibacter spongiae]